MTRRFKLILPVAMLILLTAIFFCSCKSEDKVTDTMDNLIADQSRTDGKIKEEMKNSENTLDKPLVMENPYKIAPLSALVVFSTPEETSIEMSINGKDSIKFERSKEHAIPVYGLYADFENKVELKDENGSSKTLTIKTDKYEGGVINVEKNKIVASDEFFLVSPDYENTSAYEANGKLLWYLDIADIEGAVIFLGNGRFLISDPYQGVGGIRINYSGFMDVDYLGKVRKLYLGEYGYHHEIVRIKGNSEYLLPGHNEESPFMQAVLYTVDAKTMKVKQKLDFYEIFRKEAPRWTKDTVKNEKFNFVINGIDYDEESGDALASIRSLGMIIRVNMDSGKIKWIFADPKNIPKPMHKYLLKTADGIRYPYGQHACTFLSDGRIAYHNNDVDFLASDMHLSSFNDHYSTNEIMEVDEDNMTVTTKWTYDADKDIISRMSGSLEFLENGDKLISYGSAMEKSKVKDPDKAEINDDKITEALMMELDKNDEVLWRATFPSIIHKVYRSTFYGKDAHDEMVRLPNYDVVEYEKIDGQETERHLGKEVDTGNIEAEMEDARELDGKFALLINRAVVTADLKKENEVKILFVDEEGKGTEYIYKKAGEELPIINSGKYGIRVAGLKGKQKAYVSVDGKLYDTCKIIDFD